MTDVVPSPPTGLVRLSSEIVSAYVCRNAVPVAQLGDLIVTVHAALGTLGNPMSVSVETPAKPSPTEIKSSITPEALVSFLDGGRYRMLKRHLARHGLTPAAYRERFGLPGDYPMIASVYSAERSARAKAIGLGTPRKRQVLNGAE